MHSTRWSAAAEPVRAPRFTSIAAIACALLWGGAGHAQDATQALNATSTPEQATAPAETSPALQASGQDIIVTGSRLARSTFSAPTPVTVVGAEDFERLAITNVGEGLNELPAFRPSTTPTTQGFGSFNVGAQIVNLRGLGVTRNLILVDGRRFAPTTREGSVDLNLIPSIMIARTEVVTGGASAAYGSDAIAGVVNIILDKRLDGVKAQVDQGISEAGDGRDFHAGVAFGTGFAGGAVTSSSAASMTSSRASATASSATGARPARSSPTSASPPTASPTMSAATPMRVSSSTPAASS